MSCECKWNIKFPTSEFLYSFYHYNKTETYFKIPENISAIESLVNNQAFTTAVISILVKFCNTRENMWLYNTFCIGVNWSGENERSAHRWKIMLKHIVLKWSGNV
jgi:hypothetical protein